MAEEQWLTQYVPLRYNMRTFSGSDVTVKVIFKVEMSISGSNVCANVIFRR